MQYVYSFLEGNQSMQSLLGGKGANLSEMTRLGLPVPFGFVISTEACNYFLSQKNMPTGFENELKAHMDELEHKMSKGFGDGENPLLVSVRSGSQVSMPGMMDTILNLGLNESTLQGMIRKTGNARFCYDAYRRFVAMFANVVLNVPMHFFENILHTVKEHNGIELDTELQAEDWRVIVDKYKEVVLREAGRPFPEDPNVQLKLAIEAVFNSWNNKRAFTYRNMHNIAHNMGTAVTVQAMVFGNMGEASGTGVAFTRNPSNGEHEFFGEFLSNAQGEDVVAGIRTPEDLQTFKSHLPEVYGQLFKIQADLESHYHDMQDIEFTVEEGKLYILQTRSGKRTARAAIKIAVDMVAEGLIDKREALLRIDPHHLNTLLHPSIDPQYVGNVLASGLPASPGAACGKIVFDADKACHLQEEGEKVLLVRKDTSPEDIHGMHAAEGILTRTGGMTSHAAVVARGMGKPCVAGCKALNIDEEAGTLQIGEIIFKEGDVLTIDGGTGRVMEGEAKMVSPEFSDELRLLMSWADEIRTLKVRANADNIQDAEVARNFGAEGIGLCRTEHMFFDENRISLVRRMILAQNPEARDQALAELLPMQREDFIQLFSVMDNLPVTVRLLDPPLHEFLPNTPDKIQVLADVMNVSEEVLSEAVKELHEFNPMLGHRGCRLGITSPAIYKMQVRAIFQAAVAVQNSGKNPIVEIEIPFIGHINEFNTLKAMVLEIANEMGPFSFKWTVGTMIETPRACVTADELAREAEFFSFGTNDLTQMTYGLSRDDAGTFLPQYIQNGILPEDPTSSIDREGVGILMRIAVEKGRKVKPDLEIGICGEHGGETRSIAFCHEIGLDYVSCSPFRVPVARLAAAQAALLWNL